MGALGYLRKDYRAAVAAFDRAESDEPGARERALVGQAAALAQTGNAKRLATVLDEAGTPSDDGLRIGLAHAAIDGGAVNRAGVILWSHKPQNQNEAYAKAIGVAEDDLTLAQLVLTEGGESFGRPEFSNPAYEKFIRQLIFILTDSNRDLAATFTRMTEATDPASRDVIFAGTLYRLEEPRAAARLAEDATHAQPAYREAWNVLAATQISEEDYRGAARSLKISLDLDDSDPDTWYLRSELERLQGNDKQADEYRKRAELLGYKSS